MKRYSNRRPSRKKILYVGNIGFPRRLRWTRPFTVAVFRMAVTP